MSIYQYRKVLHDWKFETTGYSGNAMNELKFGYQQKHFPEQDKPLANGYIRPLTMRRLAGSDIWAAVDHNGENYFRATRELCTGTVFVFLYYMYEGDYTIYNWKSFKIQENETRRTIVIHMEKSFFGGLKIKAIELKE